MYLQRTEKPGVEIGLMGAVFVGASRRRWQDYLLYFENGFEKDTDTPPRPMKYVACQEYPCANYSTRVVVTRGLSCETVRTHATILVVLAIGKKILLLHGAPVQLLLLV